MFGVISALVPHPSGCPERAHRMEVLTRVLDGRHYDVLPHEFHDEKNRAGEYVPLRSRRPSVRYPLCRLVVEDSVAFLFGEGRFPAVESADRDTHETVAAVLAQADVAEVFTEAAIAGSVGSVAVQFRVLQGRVFLSVLSTQYLTPEWDPAAPDRLLVVREAYQVRGDVLRVMGYAIRDRDTASWFWHRREWTADAETWFLPQLVIEADEGRKPQVDPARTVRHGLGFVPLTWIKNLPGGIAPDGGCTFRPAIETNIEIDYQLSQAGRALKYAADPLLMIREPAAEAGEMIRSAGNALVVSEKGDAKLVEINGSASAAVIEYVRALREMALEGVHGNRANADRLGAAQSGRAMELLYAPLLNLADRLRTSYGKGLLAVAEMVVRASQRYPLTLRGEAIPALDAAVKLTLRWPPYFVPTQADLNMEAGTLAALREAGHISQDTAIKRTAGSWDVTDVDAEAAAIRKDKAEADARATKQGARTESELPPA